MSEQIAPPVSRRPLAAMLAFALLGCGGPAGSPLFQSPSAPAFSTFQAARFTFRYTALDSSTVGQTAAAVEAEYARITGDLGVAEMPTVVVTLYPDIDALRQAVSPIVGSIPSFATGLITGADAVHILSPNLAASWSYREAITSIVHEFAHCVSLRLNPDFANNPRWLWESVALFEARQYEDARTLAVVAGPPPTLAQLSSQDNTTVYAVGAWIGRFVVETRGWDAWRALIRANGDLDRVLGKTEAAFLADWAIFVRGHISL